MTGLESAATSVAFKAALAAGRRFTATTEFDRLCERLADRFSDLGWNDAEFKAWAGNDQLMAALGTYLLPPHAGDRTALITALTATVGQVNAATSAEAFAEQLADAMPEELRFAKRGDSLLRSEIDDVKQAVAAAADKRVTTIDDAFDRLDEVGKFLASRDDYFSYLTVTNSASQAAAAGSVMSVERTTESGSSRIDVVPLSEEAVALYGPELLLRPDGGPSGKRAAGMLREALQAGSGVDIREGLTVEFSRMPPAFADRIGRRVAGRVLLRPSPAETAQPAGYLWPARFKTKTDRGIAVIDVDLRPTAAAPPGWDAQLVGRHGGMSVTGLFRAVSGASCMQWDFSHARDESPLREQVAALKFIDAFSGAGRLIVSTRADTKAPKLVADKLADDESPEAERLLEFLEAVLTIQDWTGIEYKLAEEIGADEVRAVFHIANMIRNHGRPIRWHNWGANLPATGVERLRAGGTLRITHTLTTNVLGREVVLGRSAIETTKYRVASVSPPDDQGRVEVAVEPQDERNASTFQHLFRDSVPRQLPSSRRRPPPPPKKRPKHGSGKKRNRRRRC